MPYPKYFVTYILSTHEAGSNMFWHAFLALSMKVDEKSSNNVEDAVGFYSTVPDSTVNPLIKWLKRLLGFKQDLQQSHGHLQKEKMRELDGPGLRGLTFEVTFEQYTHLKEAYTRAQQQEKKAIEEYNEVLRKQNKPVNGHTRWRLEQQMVRHGHEPRLYPFHLELGFNLWTKFGFTTSASRTCKTRALDLLLDAKIIDSALYAQLLSEPATQAFPRCSQIPIPPLQLISQGDRKQEKKFHNRTWENNNKLYFAHRPWLFTPNPAPQALATHSENYRVISEVINRLNTAEQRLLQKLSQTGIPSAQAEELRDLLLQLKNIRERFIASPDQQERMIADPHSDLANINAMINAALMSVNPERIHHSFLGRARENVAIRNISFGLIILAALPFATIAQFHFLLLVAANCLFLIWQSYKAFQIYAQETVMIKDYTAYRNRFYQLPTPAPSSPSALSSIAVDDGIGLSHAMVPN
jgi:hypothetical protein